MCFEENGALYDLCRLDFNIERPTYTKLNFSSGAGDLVPDGVAPLRRRPQRRHLSGHDTHRLRLGYPHNWFVLNGNLLVLVSVARALHQYLYQHLTS